MYAIISRESELRLGRVYSGSTSSREDTMQIYRDAIMSWNKISWTAVGADVSRPPPIHRPSLAFSDISLHVLNCIIGPRRVSCYPDLKVKLHHCAPTFVHAMLKAQFAKNRCLSREMSTLALSVFFARRTILPAPLGRGRR